MSDDLRDQQYAHALAELHPELRRRAKALSFNELSETTMMAELAAAYDLGIEQERERYEHCLSVIESIKIAVAEERERCAQIADRFAQEWNESPASMESEAGAAETIAAAIRAAASEAPPHRSSK